MAAIQWDLTRWEQEQREQRRPAPRPLRVVTAPPSQRRPSPALLRRRRLVALVVALAIVVSVGAGLVRWATASAAAGVTHAAPTVLVAQPGDSYWTLAGRLGIGGDRRSVVDALVAANGGGDLHAGDRIVLPR